MGTHSLQKILNILNEILSLEWLIYYKYWMGTQVIRSFGEDNLADFISRHASKEFENAQRISYQIVRIGGIPLFDVSAWEQIFDVNFHQEKESLIVCILDNYIIDAYNLNQLSNHAIRLLSKEDKEVFYLIELIICQNTEHRNILQQKIESLRITHGS